MMKMKSHSRLCGYGTPDFLCIFLASLLFWYCGVQYCAWSAGITKCICLQCCSWVLDVGLLC